MIGYLKYYNVIVLLLASVFPDTVIGTVLSETPISTESGVIEERVKQLERIASAHSQLLIQLQQQLSDNQNDIDSFRGRFQENQHKLDQITEYQEKILLQTANNISSDTKTTQQRSNLDGLRKSTISDESVVSGTKVSDHASVVGSDATADYNAAITLVWDKLRQNDAIVAFQNFIKNYPNSTYQPNANYWLGQLTYNKGEKDDAAFYFSYVVKNYPKSSKAPDAMFKVGAIMQDKGDLLKAKAIYQKVLEKYPGTEGAQQAKNYLNLIK